MPEGVNMSASQLSSSKYLACMLDYEYTPLVTSGRQQLRESRRRMANDVRRVPAVPPFICVCITQLQPCRTPGQIEYLGAISFVMAKEE